MDESRHRDGVIPLAGRYLWLLIRYGVLWTRYGLLVALDNLLRLSRP